jgi:O-antigen/teichoic acid export membrane protein
LAYQFGFILVQVTVAPYSQAWNPQRFEQAREPRAVRDELYNRGFLLYNLLLITGAVGISLFVRPALQIMSASAFHSAANVVPLIAASMVFMCWDGAMQFGAQVAEKPKYVMYSTWIAVLVMVALYWALIPRLGALGAALATLLGFAVQFFAQYSWSQKVWPISYQWAPILRLLAYAAIVVLINQWAGIIGRGIFAQITIGLALLLLYGAALWWGGVIAIADRQRILQLARERLPAWNLLGAR